MGLNMMFCTRKFEDSDKAYYMLSDFSDIQLLPADMMTLVNMFYDLRSPYYFYGYYDDYFTCKDGRLLFNSCVVFDGCNIIHNRIQILCYKKYFIVTMYRDSKLMGTVLVNRFYMSVCGSVSSCYKARPSKEMARLMMSLKYLEVVWK